MSPKTIALFGGSFNPIHLGHIALAQAVIKGRFADEVWMLVSPQNPLKKQDGLQPEEVRLALAEKALQSEQYIHVSDFEFRLPRPSYTWNTLQALSSTYPNITFKLLIGADNWLVFDHWAHYQDILRHYELLVYPRPDSPIHTDRLPSNVTLISSPLYPFSSTDIRQRVKAEKSIKGMVADSIVEDVERIYK